MAEEILELEVVQLGSKGEGIAKFLDKDIFVPFTLPGEKIKVLRIKNKRRPNYFELQEVLIKAPERIEPFCKYFAKCGGCAVQHLKASNYKKWKEDLIKNPLKQKKLKPQINDLEIVNLGVRRRCSISYENFKGSIEFGFFKKGSKRIVDIEHCPLFIEEINALLEPLRNLLKDITLPRETGHFLISSVDNGIDLAFCPHQKYREAELNNYFIEFAKKYNIARITRAGKELIIENYMPYISFGSKQVNFPAAAFLQPSKQGEELLLKAVKGFIKKYAVNTKKILDLCSGLGTFSLPLTEFGRVTAIDVFNASLQELAKNTDFPLEVLLRNLFNAPLTDLELEQYNLIIIDPPRSGMSDQIKEIAKTKDKLIIYISCDSGSFVRDAKILEEGGYKLTELTPIDQFIYTSHLELVGVFI